MKSGNEILMAMRAPIILILSMCPVVMKHYNSVFTFTGNVKPNWPSA
jgi:hypothetical protein